MKFAECVGTQWTWREAKRELSEEWHGSKEQRDLIWRKQQKSSASVRVLLLSDELLEVLKGMKKSSQDNLGLIFTDIKGEALKYNAIQSAFNASFKALNLPWRSTHILRHSYATVALMATNSLSAVQATLGHTSSRMTERYAKVIALLDRSVAEKTAKSLDIFSRKKISK